MIARSYGYDYQLACLKCHNTILYYNKILVSVILLYWFWSVPKNVMDTYCCQQASCDTWNNEATKVAEEG